MVWLSITLASEITCSEAFILKGEVMVDIRRILDLRERNPAMFVREVKGMYEQVVKERCDRFLDNPVTGESLNLIITANEGFGIIRALEMLAVAFEWHENEKAG